MRQWLDIPDLYADALYEAGGRSDDTGEPRPLPETCPFVLDDLIASRPDVETPMAKLGG